MAARSKEKLANRSLRLVGGSRISSFTDGSSNANAVNDVYDGLLESALAFPWGFAKARKKLAQMYSVPAFGFDYAYSLPSDWIFTVSVHDNDSGTGTITYKEEQVDDKHVLVTNCDTVYIRYTKLETDPNKWTASFYDAVTYLLAGELAVPVASSESLETRRTQQGKRRMQKAQSRSAQGSTPEPRNRGSWAGSRNRWR